MKVLIVDDHAIVREGIAFWLQSEGGYEICALADNFRSAMNAVEIHQPEIVITDMNLPDKSGLDLIREVLPRFPKTLFLVISMHDESIYAERVLRAGGRGYIMKDAASDELIAAIEKIVSGDVYVSNRLASLLLQRLTGVAEQDKEKHSVLQILSDRELQVLELVGRALTNQAIADRLHIGPRTVDAHKTHIKKKLKISDNNALLKYAIQWVENDMV